MQDTIFQPVPVKALTIKQPWAWLIAEGIKDVENRTWKTNYRGFLAIHVSKSNSDLSQQVFSQIEEILSDPKFQGVSLPSIEELKQEQGNVIAIAKLIGLTKGSHSPFAVQSQYQWHLRCARRIEPIPQKGRLGLWDFSSSSFANSIDIKHETKPTLY